MSQAYGRTYRPPIPVLQVRFRSSATERTTDRLQAIVDTAADGTIVPLNYLLSLGVKATAPG